VVKSQNLTVLSPAPDAKNLPFGEKFATITGSPWPGIELVHLETGLTLNTACG
jgi:hypothetical protein